MIAQNTSGSILLVASVASRHILFPAQHSVYGVSKAGILQLTTTLAAEWAEHGIRVNSISPGIIRTPLISVEGAKPGIQSWVARTPLGRIGEPDELSGTVVLLCSEAGRFITRMDIYVDGMWFLSLSWLHISERRVCILGGAHIF